MSSQKLDLTKLRARFFEKVERIPFLSCLVWVGATKNIYGHGVMGSGQGKGAKLVPAHKLAYMLEHSLEEVPSLHALHRCDNPWCVNPEHIYLGTHQDNMADARSRGQLGPGRNSGLRNGSNCKLSEQQVQLLRQPSIKRGQLSLWAREWGISNTQITSIRGYRKWKHI